MAKAPEEHAHLEWLGYVQPVGLVVSVPALLDAQCYINKNLISEHAKFLDCLVRDEKDQVIAEIDNVASFTEKCLDWEPKDLVAIPCSGNLSDEMACLEVLLPQYKETLRPSHAVPVFQPKEGQNSWLLLIKQLDTDVNLDEASSKDTAQNWNAPPHAKFERLLRETGVPIGLLCNGRQIRLVYAPKGETSGYATFNVAEMLQIAGRPMFAALQMLLNAERMFSLGEKQRLPAILENSRKYQNNVSTKLAAQVTSALFELLRGFQAADDHRNGELLRDILRNNPQHVYHGLLTVLMRMVFVLYAEDRSLASSDPIYTNHYSISGLFERLRADAGRFPDTMDQRFGAWSQILTVFRLIYEGGSHRTFSLPARNGYLFDPARYPFLEGRFDDGDVESNSPEEAESELQVPRISDGIIYRVLENLLILDGERLSYRSLDVEQIGSVYETIMGYRVEVAIGRSIAIKPVKSHGAPSTINLDALLEASPADRPKRLKEWSDQKLPAAATKALKAAETIEALLESLDKKIAKDVTPAMVPAKSMVLQPSEERRRSGSHYTPRSLTVPIVRTTLEPILKQLYDQQTELPTAWEPTAADQKRYTKGELEERVRLSEIMVEHAKLAREKGSPHPSQILGLKICDPAMGSGAFLVEVCRHLGDELVAAWHAHDCVPTEDIPSDEDEILYARRLVAQRCLYGVDKNVMAVDLAKLSLWLVTLAKDQAFTFLDHSLSHGDSLVGLSREQIIGFHWEVKKQKKFGEDLIQRRLDRATESRAKILNAREDVPYRDQQRRMVKANEALDFIRELGDACVSCFFAEPKKKAREEEADRAYGLASSYVGSLKSKQVDHASRQSLAQAAARLSSGEHPIPAFHWEIEFPEVFARENGGFDAFVGNPPFAGKVTLIEGSHENYVDWLKEVHHGAHGNADLVAHFFRAAFNRLRVRGCLGLIATNTVGQGDTRNTGLTNICLNDGFIFNATRRFSWPGLASVNVSVVHIRRGAPASEYLLDGKRVNKITAYLFHAGVHEDPKRLSQNEDRSFQGSILLGKGFIFAPNPKDETTNTTADLDRVLSKSPRNKDRVFSYIGVDEVNNDPRQSTERHVINFGLLSEQDARAWPDLMEIVEAKVKPERIKKKDKTASGRWWQHYRPHEDLYERIVGLGRVMVSAQTSKFRMFAFQPDDLIYDKQLNVFAFSSNSAFATLQSRPHEVWSLFFGSTFEDRPIYTLGDCFNAFPFPEGFEKHDNIESIGKEYEELRAQIMLNNNEGLTSTYNRFHDPHEQSEGILELRRLHGLMDGAVLRAYGWDDLADKATCEFLLDYEEEENDDPRAKKSKKKKPWRYRWPDEFRDEVLARLLELNEQRHKEEFDKGLVKADGSKPKTISKNKSKRKEQDGQKKLF
jgi:hypothetical protein